MKKQLLMLAAVGSLLQAQAQSRKIDFGNQNAKSKSGKMIQGILKRQGASNHAQKPTQIKQRVIAQSFNEMDGGDVYQDSIVYKYSGTRGSAYDFNEIGYNFEFRPVYSPMYNDYRYPFNPFNLLADSIESYGDGSKYYTEKAFYRTDNKLDSVFAFYNDGSSIIPSKVNVTYSSSGHPLKLSVKESDDNGATFEERTYAVYTYNNDFSKVLTDTTYIIGANVIIANNYSYNANNKVDTLVEVVEYMGSVQSTRYIFDYYNDGKIRTVLNEYEVNGTWLNAGMDSLGYAAGSDYYTYWKQSTAYDEQTQQYMAQFLTEQFPGTNGLPDSTWQSTWDDNTSSWIKQVKHEYTFNSFNNPATFKSINYDMGPTPIEEGYVNFYYEEYDDGVSVKNITSNNQFKAYPNPFQNNITIDWKGKIANEKVVVKMLNILGQEVYKQEITMNSGLNEIQLPDVHAGNYVLIIQDAKGKTYQDKLIKK